MRRAHIGLALLAVVSLSIASACAFRKRPPDPVEVEQQLENAKNSERELVRGTVEDPTSVARLLELLAKRDQLVAEHARTVQRYRDEMQALNADYDATREDFQQLIADYNAARRPWQGKLVELMAEMKAATTPEEWKRLSKYQLNRLNPRDVIYAGKGR